MKANVFVLVMVSGLCLPPTCFPRKYVLVEIAKTWQAAQSYCRETYSDLATVKSAAEMDEVVEVAQRYYNGHVWIGLRHMLTDWKWSLEKEGYYGEGEEDLRMWRHNEPDDGTMGYENCVLMDVNGRWVDAPCTLRFGFVCTEGPPASPTYIPVESTVTMSEARSYCREHHTDLASIRTRAENEAVRASLASRSWIGLYRDPWKWSDGTPLSFIRWHSGPNEPNGGIHSPCVLAHLASWEDDLCERPLFFICQIVPEKQRVVKVKLTKRETSGDLENAAELLLKQLYQKLEKVGVTQWVKLAWRKQPDGKVFHAEERSKKPEEDGCTHGVNYGGEDGGLSSP